MAGKKYINKTIERQLMTYPHPRYYAFVLAYSKQNLIHKSAAVEEMIKHFYNKFTDVEKEKYAKAFLEMTDEEKKHPHKL
jgi:hypothetical protein